MASIRNKNTKANFELEASRERHYQTSCSYLGTEPYFSGDGLLASSIPRCLLSSNSVDIESSLFGITLNLVNHHSIVKIKSASIFNGLIIIEQSILCIKMVLFFAK